MCMPFPRNCAAHRACRGLSLVDQPTATDHTAQGTAGMLQSDQIRAVRLRAAPAALMRPMRPCTTGAVLPPRNHSARPCANPASLADRHRLAGAFRNSMSYLAAASRPAGRLHDVSCCADKTGAVIVGGGPVGLAAALMLSRRGWKDITVVEQQSSVTYVNPDRSYVYMIDGRGRKFTVPHGLSDAMSAAAVTIDGLNVTVIAPDGTTKTRSEGKVQPDIFFQLIPRAKLLQVFAAALETDAAAQAAVKLRAGMRCAAVDRQPDGRVAVTLKPSNRDQRGGVMPSPTATSSNSSSSSQPGAATGGNPRPGNIIAAATSLAPAADGAVEGSLGHAEVPAAAAAAVEPEVLYPRLLLACDGIHSSVRGALSSWAPATYATSSFPSLSSGMRFKILQLPPNPVTKGGLVMQNDKIWVLEGAPCSKLQGFPPLRLGMWPLKDPAAGRTANLNTLPHHPIWDITDPEEMYSVLGESFPQLDWRQAVPPEAMARFTASRGGAFPAPTAVNHLTWAPQEAAAPASPAHTRPSDATGVVLLGDSAHCFPPDVAQGLNSGLEDVATFAAALEEAGDDVAAALDVYERRRQPDTQALAQLMQVAGPLQYKQYPQLFKLWLLKAAGHVLLNKAFPFWIEPPVFKTIWDFKRSYASIWEGLQRSRAAMRRLGAATLVLLVALALRGTLGA